MNAKAPKVSDHAVLRYIQNAVGVDPEAIRARIARRAAEATARNGEHLVIDGAQYQIIADEVTTASRPPKRKK